MSMCHDSLRMTTVGTHGRVEASVIPICHPQHRQTQAQFDNHNLWSN